MSTGGDDASRWLAIGVATGVSYDCPVLGLLGAEALQQHAHGRMVGFVQTGDIGRAHLCRDKCGCR